MPEKGIFIVVEGIDGSGKTTQAQLLTNWIFSNYKTIDTVVLTREPSNTRFTKEIHERLSQKNKETISMLKDRMLELYVLDREEHVDTLIAPLLSQKHVVVCDRYKYSTIAYQSSQGILTSHAIRVNAGFPIPDIVLFFNASPESCVERMEKSGKIMDKFEKKEFLEKVKSQYLQLPHLLPNENILIIDANRPIAEIHADVIKAVKIILDDFVK
ncbi:MAG: dTMP kinase [Candidatus Diapherotrites archaeon]